MGTTLANQRSSGQAQSTGPMGAGTAGNYGKMGGQSLPANFSSILSNPNALASLLSGTSSMGTGTAGTGALGTGTTGATNTGTASTGRVGTAATTRGTEGVGVISPNTGVTTPTTTPTTTTTSTNPANGPAYGQTWLGTTNWNPASLTPGSAQYNALQNAVYNSLSGLSSGTLNSTILNLFGSNLTNATDPSTGQALFSQPQIQAMENALQSNPNFNNPTFMQQENNPSINMSNPFVQQEYNAINGVNLQNPTGVQVSQYQPGNPYGPTFGNPYNAAGGTAGTSGTPTMGGSNNAYTGGGTGGYTAYSPTTTATALANMMNAGGGGGYNQVGALNQQSPYAQGYQGASGQMTNPNTGGYSNSLSSEINNPGMGYQAGLSNVMGM